MTTRLILIRHGESEGNKKKEFQSPELGTGLTDVGIKQSETIVERLKNTKVDAIYSSPTKRTIETAKIINKDRNLEIKKDEGIGERNFGILIGTPLNPKDQTEEQKEIHKKRTEFEDYTVPEGESFVDVKKRSMKVVNKILNEEKDKTIVIVSHGNIIRSIVSSMFNIPLKKTYDNPSRNTCYTEIEIDKEPKLIKFFCAKHLED